MGAHLHGGNPFWSDLERRPCVGGRWMAACCLPVFPGATLRVVRLDLCVCLCSAFFTSPSSSAPSGSVLECMKLQEKLCCPPPFPFPFPFPFSPLLSPWVYIRTRGSPMKTHTYILAPRPPSTTPQWPSSHPSPRKSLSLCVLEHLTDRPPYNSSK